jgi:hypothetical protein
MQLLQKYHVQIAAAGLVGLALYQLTQEQYAQAWHALMLALASLGIRLALPDPLAEKEEKDA